MTTFFASDHHFGHASILAAGRGRPFASVEVMDEEMIRRWNAAVGPSDEVWHLGDFWWRGHDGPGPLLERLQGRKHLVTGNHDGNRTTRSAGWASVQPYRELRLDGHKLVLCHYPIEVWNRAHFGAIHLHGHCHGNLPGNRLRCDVGVDCWDFRPVTLPEIKGRLATLPAWRAKDHHDTGGVAA